MEKVQRYSNEIYGMVINFGMFYKLFDNTESVGRDFWG